MLFRSTETAVDDEPARPGCPHVLVYEVGGPLFFGVAQRFVDVARFTRNAPDVLILRMRQVPTIDATGAEALETLAHQAQARGIHMALAGVKPRVRAVLERMGTEALIGRENIFPDLDSAMAHIKPHGCP